ncbi:hypothetical protein SDC9_200840 [bioreactor metagenome]|uniref:Uncharacterized protein n=1 Tax=bioreactor metagenome TaxID=1076179 RepID=A0A645IQ17_9ZZZZ
MIDQELGVIFEHRQVGGGEFVRPPERFFRLCRTIQSAAGAGFPERRREIVGREPPVVGQRFRRPEFREQDIALGQIGGGEIRIVFQQLIRIFIRPVEVAG